jgi:HEPN domain-containing protein
MSGDTARARSHSFCFAHAVERPATTADLRPRTGLDRTARKILLRALTDAGILLEHLVDTFFRHDLYADLEDYLVTVEKVWGADTAWEVLGKLRGDEGPTVYQGLMEDNVPGGVPALPFLLEIPEPDFLTCVEIGDRMATSPNWKIQFRDTVNRVCEGRGIPYRLQEILSGVRFVWVGDAVVSELALKPVLSALDDPRLAQGPRQEFEAARHELRQGTPGSRKQAVAEACNAVESALKVLLQEHERLLPERQNLDALLKACVESELIATATQELVASPGRFGNRRARHGGGALPHDVTREEAETVVSAAAVAITFIAMRLP